MIAFAPSVPSLLGSHWQAAWTLDALVGVLAFAYVAAARHTRSWPVRRTVSYLGGLAVVLVALQSGIDAYDDRLLSVHMVQHMLLLLGAPPLLLAGRPVVLALRVLPTRERRVLASALTKVRPLAAPWACLAIFDAVLLTSHMRTFYDATLRHPQLHGLEHGAYLAAGALLWSPLIDVDPAPRHRLGGVARFVYVLAAMPAMAVLGAYLNRATTLVYPPYAAPAKRLGVPALLDQAHAGAIMWVGGGVVLGLAGLFIAMAQMQAEERRVRRREAAGSLVAVHVPGKGGNP